MNKRRMPLANVTRVLGLIAAGIVTLIILWLDATTSIWEQRVILSGLAASLATFLVTYIVVNSFLHRARERRWAPVTGLALTDLLHSLADGEASEVNRGIVISRSFSIPELADPDDDFELEQWAELLDLVLEERDMLTHRLAAWSQFLASSADNEEIMQHVASASMRLDRIRDAVLQAEAQYSPEGVIDQQALAKATEAVHIQVAQYNAHLEDLVNEIKQRLVEFRDISVPLGLE